MSLRRYIKLDLGRKIEWVTRYKERILLRDLEQSHLLNCIRMVQRQVDILDAECAAGYCYSGSGEMAQYYSEISADHAHMKAQEKRPILELLQYELVTRYLANELPCVHGELAKRIAGPNVWTEMIDYLELKATQKIEA